MDMGSGQDQGGSPRRIMLCAFPPAYAKASAEPHCLEVLGMMRPSPRSPIYTASVEHQNPIRLDTIGAASALKVRGFGR
jgi:hypothetical protein